MHDIMHALKIRLSFLMFMGVFINYLDRVNISNSILLMAKDLHLNFVEQGVALSAFSWGYVFLMLPGGLLVDRFGPRITNALSCCLWSLFTALTAFVNGIGTLIFTRVLLGMAEAPIFPSNAKVVATFFSLQERGRATAFFDVGSYVGTALAAPLITLIMLTCGWRSSFVLCSLLGILWSICWFVIARSPSQGGYSVSKLDALKAKVISRPTNQANKWAFLLKDKKIWSISIGFFCYNYLKSFFLTWFPAYLVTAHHFTFVKVGLLSFIPPFCAVFAEIFAGYLTDKLIAHGVSISTARKIPLCTGLLLSSVIVVANYTQSALGVIFFMALSYASLIATSASIWAIPGDIAPNNNLVGTIGGIQNTFSNIAGIVSPIITGFIYSITFSFFIPLIVASVLTVIGAFSYWFGAGKLEPIEVKVPETQKVALPI